MGRGHLFIRALEVDLGKFEDEKKVSLRRNRNVIGEVPVVVSLCLVEDLVLRGNAGNHQSLPVVGGHARVVVVPAVFDPMAVRVPLPSAVDGVDDLVGQGPLEATREEN